MWCTDTTAHPPLAHARFPPLSCPAQSFPFFSYLDQRSSKNKATAQPTLGAGPVTAEQLKELLATQIAEGGLPISFCEAASTKKFVNSLLGIDGDAATDLAKQVRDRARAVSVPRKRRAYAPRAS